MKEKLEKTYEQFLKWANKLVTKKNILIVTIIITIALLIPILWVSFYTHPSADDFSYGINTINVINDEGIIGLLQGSIKTLVHFYKTWQGTYSAIILFSLNPNVFGNNMYFLTTFIIIGMLFLGLYYFFKQCIYKILKLDKMTFWIFLLIFFLLAIETMPDKVQGLFWWNGASYYMIFFSLELIEIGLILKRYFIGKKTKLNYILLYLLIAIIGGGNFITALQQIILLFFLNIYLIFYKKDKSAIPLLLISLISLGISAIAPGNAIRAAAVTGMNPIKAIFLSFYYSLHKIFTWMTPLNFIVLLVLTLLLFPTYKNSRLSFKYPLIVLIFIYCIFSAEFTPTLYSAANIGEGRLWNIMYISYLIFVVIGIYYIIGFIRKQLIEKNIFSKNSSKNIISLVEEYGAWIFLITLGLITINTYIDRESMATQQTYRLLKSNEAKIYDKEYKERVKILEDNSIKKVKFKSLSVYPYPIFYCEFSEDETSWLNKPIAKIYNKDYVKLVKKETKEKEIGE